MVNLGCGQVWHRDWINLDHQPSSPEIRAFDIRKPLPFGDATVDAVYASHVLEHLDRADGERLLHECWRVLKPGGLLRLVVPDLENLCRFYLQRLIAVAEQPSGENQLAYDWAYLHLLDQHVRRCSGGEMAAFSRRPGLEAVPEIRERLSSNMLSLRQGLTAPPPAASPQQARSRFARWRHALRSVLRGAIKQGGFHAACLLLPRRFVESLRDALFLRSGELHRIAYDRYSLPRLLRQAGFDEIAVLAPNRSAIPGFDRMDLDCHQGRARMPGSLYVEAARPAAAVEMIESVRLRRAANG